MTERFVLHAGDDSWSRILANLWTFLNALGKSRSWVIEIKRYARPRSVEQNSALWGLAYPILANAIGEDVNTIHEFCLGEHFGWVESNIFGRRKLKPARTTTTGYRGENSILSKAEFAEYFSFVQRMAAEHGIHIPDPDPLRGRA